MNKWTEKYMAKEKIRNEEIKKIMSDTDYFEWLIQFTQDKSVFFDSDGIYLLDEVSNYDRKNIKKLCLLYEGIDKYASQNYIYPSTCEFGNFYKVKLDKYGFEIGILVGQGVEFFCKKVSLENDNDFIDFNDIMAVKKQDKVDDINKILNSLSRMVIAAYENGVPTEAIVNIVDDTVKDIVSKKEDKILVRKK